MFSLLSRFLFPEYCYRCRAPGSSLCLSCAATLGRSTKLSVDTFAVFDYGSTLVSRAIWEIKYHRHSELAKALARAAVPAVAEYLHKYNHPIVLIPVPGSGTKSRERGYNQASLIARWWQPKLSNTVLKHLLQKTRFTLQQAKCSRTQRLMNVQHSMSCTTRLDPSYTYVIIDDVTTTGSTFIEARRALLNAGATTIVCVALAHGYKRGKK